MFRIGDIVGRRSYGGDIPFEIIEIKKDIEGKKIYVLRGVFFRIEADSYENDLIRLDIKSVYINRQRKIMDAHRHMLRNIGETDVHLLNRAKTRPGKILHIDSSSEFADICARHYRSEGIPYVTKVIKESEQPYAIKKLLMAYRPDILIITGHDGIKKDAADIKSIDSYRNSKYYIESAKIARELVPDYDELCIFAGACQSYYEEIMKSGANFASSPGRILIHCLDPAIVCERVALTSNTKYVIPEQAIRLTQSGSKGIGGIKTKGHLTII